MAFSHAHFGPGTGSIHLDNVGCSGGEGRLIDCSRAPVFHCARGHSEDAGVRCQIQGMWYEGCIASSYILIMINDY